MLNMPTLKFDKSLQYLQKQLLIQNNNKQLILDIIANIGVLNTSSSDNHEEILDKANDILQTISNNITTIEQLEVEVKNITKDLSFVLSEQNKRTKTKEFFIAAIKNVQANILTTTQNIQKIETKLESDNEEFGSFIIENDLKYNYTSVDSSSDIEEDKYEFTSFSLNDEEATVMVEDAVSFNDHEAEAIIEDTVELVPSEEQIVDNKIDKLTAEFKAMLKDASLSDDAESAELIKEFLAEKLGSNPFADEKESDVDEPTLDEEIEITDEDLLAAIEEDFIEEELKKEFSKKTTENCQELIYTDIESNVINDIKENISIYIYNRFDRKPITFVSQSNPFYDEDSFMSMHQLARSTFYSDEFDEGFSMINPYLTRQEEVTESSANLGIDTGVDETVPTAFDSLQFMNDILLDLAAKEQEEELLEEELLKEELMKDFETAEQDNIEIEDEDLLDYIDESDLEEDSESPISYEVVEPKSKYEDLRLNIINATENNPHLLISEKTQKIFLPYKISELEEYMKAYPDAYPVIQDVVEQEFTFNYNYFNKHPMQSRFKELYLLMKDREGLPLTEVLQYAFKMSKRTDINPAIIAACKSKHEFESYLYYFDEDNIKGFKFFDILYEIDDSNR